MQLAIWIIAAIVIGLWSLFAWGVHSLVVLSAQQAGAWAATLKDLPGAAWLDAWFPGWQALLKLALSWLPTVTATLGAAAPWLGALAWLAWGVVTLLLLGLAGLLHFAVRLVPATAQPLHAG